MKESTFQPKSEVHELSDLAYKADLADYSPVRGCMVIKPYGYAIWENIQKDLDRRIKDCGYPNAYFPLLIPESFMRKEAEHVEGFAPECAVVTHAGGEKLEEPLVIRPTSETIIYHMFGKWIRSWRDLPYGINQWANVVRWEMRTRLFLRTTEFLWQEGHTAHATRESADGDARRMLETYRQFFEEILALAPVVGEKSENERFAGAERTYSLEVLLRDGKALQSGTSHYLGQGFAKAFEITYQSKQNELEFAHLNSWGVSTRLIGALILGHQDELGLILPPAVAPYQVVIIPIYKTEEEKSLVLASCAELKAELKEAGLRIFVDDDDQSSPGAKFNKWELKGAPLRIHLGPRDVKNDCAELARRDTRVKTRDIPRAALSAKVQEELSSIQAALLERNRSWVRENTFTVESLEELSEKLSTGNGGFARVHWAGGKEEEKELQTKTKASIRVCPFDEADEEGVCIMTGKPSKRRVWVAKAY